MMRTAKSGCQGCADIYIFTFSDGKIVEYRAVRDDVALMRQLGVIPTHRPAA